MKEAKRTPAVGTDSVVEPSEDAPFGPDEQCCAQEYSVDQNQNYHETRDEIVQPAKLAGEYLPKPVVDVAEKDVVV